MKLRFLLIATLALALFACSDDVDANDGDDNLRSNDDDPAAMNAHPDGEDAGLDAAGGDQGDAGTEEVADCTPGATMECADDSSLLVCNDDGDGFDEEPCPDTDPHCFQGECSDQVCEPGVPSCLDSTTAQICDEDGEGYGVEVPCSEGEFCDNGVCTTACEFGPKQVSSHFGCEYWTLFLDQYQTPEFGDGSDGLDTSNTVPHAIVVSNPNEESAHLVFETFSGATVDVADPVVPPGDSRSFDMPREEAGDTGIFRNAVFVRSSVPVTAHQFNPPNNDNIYSNDASLLLPVSSLGTEYFVINWPTMVVGSGDMPDIPGFGDDDNGFGFDFDTHGDHHSYVTIIASEPGTTNVLVNSTAHIVEGEDIAGFPPGVGRNFELNFGDVLNLQASSGEQGDEGNDLTGTHVVSDKRIAVFAGHEVANVAYDPDRDICCADHLEQQLFPIDTWGERYIAPFSPGRTNTKDAWVIVAGENDVTVRTDPPQPGAHGITIDAGESLRFFSSDDFEVEATGRISVGQFLASQDQTAEVTGDPAFVLSIPIERYRDEYHVLVPSGYEQDFITMIRPAGQEILLNDEPVDDSIFSAVGSGEYESGYLSVQAGVHILESDEPFGSVVHGLDFAVSYGYPGGLNVVGAEISGQ